MANEANTCTMVNMTRNILSYFMDQAYFMGPGEI